MQPLSEYHRRIADPKLLEAIDIAIRLNIPDTAYQAFHDQLSSAKRRKIDFLLDLEKWWNWWQAFDEEHGCVRWERRGRTKFALVMARFGDVGPYHIDNIYCASQQQNHEDVDPRKRRSCQKELARMRKAVGYQYWLTGKRGAAHPKSRAVITPDGRFESASAAGEHYGITRQAASIRAHEERLGWRWEQP